MEPIDVIGLDKQPPGARRLRDMGMARPGPKVFAKYLLPPEEAIIVVPNYLKSTLAVCIACRGYSAAEEVIYQSCVPRKAVMESLGRLLRKMISTYSMLERREAAELLSYVRDAAAHFGLEEERKSAVSKIADATVRPVEGGKGKAEE
jgi:hypothetical protein